MTARPFGRRLAIVAAFPFVLSACTTVLPSQRQYLSRPEMDPSSDRLEDSFHSHVEAAREAGMGGHGGAGGGCGCG